MADVLMKYEWIIKILLVTGTILVVINMFFVFADPDAEASQSQNITQIEIGHEDVCTIAIKNDVVTQDNCDIQYE